MQNKIGPYELRGELGRGAMAIVWRAWDPNLAREVAIKEPQFDSRLNAVTIDDMGKRFVQEGRAAARLSHPGIVSVYAADVWDGRPAIVMELVNGESLASRLSRGALTPQEAVYALDQLLDAVGYAHEHNVIHRDIKPDNIFLDSSGKVKLGDFGIARIEDPAATLGTVQGSILGTPGYMSPEQGMGSVVDARSDIFSLGVVAFEMLMGFNPFGAGQGGSTASVLRRVESAPVPPMPDSVAYGLQTDPRPAIYAALSKNPVYRPQSAAEFAAMLHGRTTLPLTPVGETPTVEIAASDAALPASATTKVTRNTWLPYVIVVGIAIGALAFMLGTTFGGVVKTVSEGDPGRSEEQTDGTHAGSDGEAQDETPGEDTTSKEEAGQDSTDGDSSTPVAETTEEETPNYADLLPRYWKGTLDGVSKDDTVITRNMRIELREVKATGQLKGICEIGVDEGQTEEGKGSYYVDGFVDWETREINFYGTDWIEKGGLGFKRRFEGRLSESFDSITGSCEIINTDSGRPGAWIMEVE